MASAHTPGPWKVEPYVDAIHIVAPDGSMVADISDRALDSAGMPPANARLIAAAPELLEACKAALRLFALGEDSESYDADVRLKACNDAIAIENQIESAITAATP